MSNKRFSYLLIVTLSITLIFIFTPLVLLVIRGVPNIYKCVQSKEILFSIKLSLITSIISTLICLVFSIPVAYTLERSNIRLKKLIQILILLPMSLPHMISGVALLLFLGNLGIGGFLSKIGLEFVFNPKGIVAAQVFVNFPFMVNMLTIAMKESGYKMEFIGRTLGCNRWQTFIYITIPLIKNSLISSSIIVWSRALGEFGAVIMLAGATSMKTEVIPTAIFMNMSIGDLDIAIGVATILIFISIISMFLVEIMQKSKSI
ncbi:ABC transporter permease [Tissierella carlieri]|uniref:ABC transporter permease n=1 Tax=Tissierella carlieri TaxID=689904 RepID=A0ABT1S7X0_9FIRM|nr:ABC transporter permease [Tissierella carlieri]MCQ4922447.1 ABC transporter permease [Tissierella carlieri]